MSTRIRTSNRRRISRAPASSQKPGKRLTTEDLARGLEELRVFHRVFRDLFPRPEQYEWSWFYLCGQLSTLVRKTMEGLALELLGAGASTVRTAQHFLGQAKWEYAPILERVQSLVADWLGEPSGVVIVDGSGFPKQGTHSVGVAPQYCGHLGKTANCQQGVFLVYSSSAGFAFVGARLYVPQEWFDRAHQAQRTACKLPESLTFQTEPALGLSLIAEMKKRAVLPFKWVTCDEGYSKSPSFLEGIEALSLTYLAEVASDTRLWEHTPAVEAPGPSRKGRPRLLPRVQRSAARPVSIRELMASLEPSQWKRQVVKEGSRGPLLAEFAFVRVTPVRASLPGPRSWAVFRRSLGPEAEVKYYLSNAPSDCPTQELVRVSGQRWPIETAIEEARGEVGLDHYETRTWLGWHHHVTLSIVAHLFLVRLQLSFQKKALASRLRKHINSLPVRLKVIPGPVRASLTQLNIASAAIMRLIGPIPSEHGLA